MTKVAIAIPAPYQLALARQYQPINRLGNWYQLVGEVMAHQGYDTGVAWKDSYQPKHPI